MENETKLTWVNACIKSNKLFASICIGYNKEFAKNCIDDLETLDILYKFYKKGERDKEKDTGILKFLDKKIEDYTKMSKIVDTEEALKVVKAIRKDFEDKPILTDEEREYLKAFLKPFKNEIRSIYKSISEYYEKEDLTIELKADIIRLPYFEKGTMYKCMEVGKDYTLDELGITYE